LTYLIFDYSFNHLSDTLTKLFFGHEFYQNVDHLYESLAHLTFSSNFNKNVDLLSVKLTQLTFSVWLNKNIDHMPKSLTHLDFNQNTDHFLNLSICPKFGNPYSNLITIRQKSSIHM
jgi:hypothetical protein